MSRRRMTKPRTAFVLDTRICDFDVQISVKSGLKTLRLTVTRDARVKLSVPDGYPPKDALRFVLEKSGWIKQKLDDVAAAPKTLITPGAVLSFLGRKAVFTHVPSAKSRVTDENERITVYCRDGLFETTAARFVKKKLLEYVIPKAAVFSALTGLYPLQITVKTLKSRWGQCNTSAQKLTFSSSLAFAPPECIDYVVLHEIAHLKFPRHDKAFYSFIEKFMPDYKIRKKALSAL